MPSIYRSGERIPGFNGVIRGGTTIVVDKPEEIQGLQAICLLTRTDFKEKNPLEAVDEFLNAPFIDLDKWFQTQQQTETFPKWQDVTSIDDLNDKQTLMFILSLAKDIWNNQGDKDALCLAMSIGDFRRSSFTFTADPVLEFEGDNTGLLFLKGSVVPTFMATMWLRGKVRFAHIASGFAVAFFRGRGVTATAIATNLVRDLRVRALRIPGVVELDNLENIDRNQLREKKGVIVFLHGLLSTDIGTFDAFIKKWKDPQQVDMMLLCSRLKTEDTDRVRCAVGLTLNDFLLVGYPHDTLKSIDQNGSELSDKLEALAGTEETPFAFVCHSRGGLVARSAAVHLYDNNPTWRTRLCGCVTFGTPHNGAALAELTTRELFLGVFVTVMAVRNTHNAAYLTEVFCYEDLERNHEILGIDNLRPARSEDDFLRKLHDKEQTAARQRCSLDIFALGGQAPREGLISGIVNRLLGNSEHDHVVETTSSCPNYLTQTGRTEQTQCDHMHYFEADPSEELHLGHAIEYLRNKLAFYPAVQVHFSNDCPKTVLPDLDSRIKSIKRDEY